MYILASKCGEVNILVSKVKHSCCEEGFLAMKYVFLTTVPNLVDHLNFDIKKININIQTRCFGKK